MGMFDRRSNVTRDSSMITEPAVALRVGMRKLWSEHILYTHLYIMAAVNEPGDRLAKLPEGARTAVGVNVPGSVMEKAGPMLGEADAAAGRLLRNQEDIGDALVPYFGREAGKDVTKLLKEHIMIAVELVDAAKKNDTDRFRTEDARWTRNADEIADHLSRANEHWPREDVASLLHLHLQLTKDATTARVKKDWATDVQKLDDLLAEAMTIADTLSTGILKKFPDKFVP